MTRRAAFAWLLAACLLASPTLAQQSPSQQRGLTASTAYQPDQLDTVNLFNGQLTLTLPIGAGYPIGPGLGLQLTLAYNSNVWDYSEEFCILGGEVRRYFLPIPDPSANAGIGWSLHLGKLYEPHHEPWNEGLSARQQRASTSSSRQGRKLVAWGFSPRRGAAPSRSARQATDPSPGIEIPGYYLPSLAGLRSRVATGAGGTHTSVYTTSVAGFAPAISYQAGGFLHQVQHANGVTWTQEIDPANGLARPQRISTTAGWDTGVYAYDGATNIQAIGSQSFRYDRYQRLISGEVPVGAQERTQTASFGVYGNLLSLTTNGSTLVTGASATANRLTGLGATYEAAGNLTRQIRNGVTYGYVWDPLNALKYLQTTDNQARVFLYDFEGERYFTFDCFPNVCAGQGFTLTSTIRGLGGQVLREYVQTIDGWEWTRDDVYRGGQVLASVVPREQGGEEVFHFHPDHLGSPRQVTDGSGTEVARHAYYPFGEEATDPGQDAFPKKFTGHERDDNGPGAGGDLDYMHARYCSPTLGRFLSFDPIGGVPGNPQSWNRYAYALNNPVNFTDPQGLFAQLFLDLAFVVFDEITVVDYTFTRALEFFSTATAFFSDFAPAGPPSLGHVGDLRPPVATLNRALSGKDELAMVEFGLPVEIIDTGGVPEFVVFLPIVRLATLGKAKTARGGIGSVAVRTTRAGDPGVRITRPDGSVIDITPNRVKEFIPNTHPKAPPGTLQRVKFDNAQPGSKGFKRNPTAEDLELLEEALERR